jgi:hypothetical protein
MSHHLDTPLAAQNGQLYIDDLYVFPGNGSTVLVMDINSDITGEPAPSRDSARTLATSSTCTSTARTSRDSFRPSGGCFYPASSKM